MLLSLDHAVWQDILLYWLGSLREIVRLDFAVDVADIKNQFRDVFAQLAFPLPVTVRVTRAKLVGLCFWMQRRNVYLNRLVAEKYFNGWEVIFAWCRNSLKQLHISGTAESGTFCDYTWDFMNIASIHCQRLQMFALSNGIEQSGETLRTILQNNASTLVVLKVENMCGDDRCTVDLDEISCPCLQVLLWDSAECASLGAFLRRCPKLSALSLYYGSYRASDSLESLISALSENCPTLKRLRLYGMMELDRAALLRIARGCRQLDFIQISNYSSAVLENFVEIMQALPHLHSLRTVDQVAETVWLEIAVRGLAPSLRVLDVYTLFTCPGFRQFTSAYPHLTGLRLLLRNTNMDKALFEHCSELKHLILDMYDQSREAVDAVLESVALCCPSLEIVEVDYGTQCNTWALQCVLDKCTQLTYLSTCYRYSELTVPPGVIVANKTIPLTQWMPAELLPAFV